MSQVVQCAPCGAEAASWRSGGVIGCRLGNGDMASCKRLRRRGCPYTRHVEKELPLEFRVRGVWE